MSRCIKHEPCPMCRKDGFDEHGNNLARYSDGGCYCFRCGYFQLWYRAKKATDFDPGIAGEQQESRGTCDLPTDSTEKLPQNALEYLRKYSLTPLDISKNSILWSEQEQRIIFPYFIGQEFIGWQGRDLTNTKKSKWYSKGDFKHAYYILGNPFSDCVVLVEDIISAIRLGNQQTCCAMPLFGSLVNTKQLLTLKERYKYVRIWLDKDKEMYSRQVSKKAREFGMDCYSIISELDPKDYGDEVITSYLGT